MGKFLEEYQGIVRNNEAIGDQLALTQDGLRDIERELGNGISGHQTLEFLKVFGATPAALNQAKLRIVNNQSYINSDVFFDVVRLTTKDNALNLETMKAGVAVIRGQNALIQSVCEKIFAKLNDSIEDNRFHKAICLRRDIHRFEYLCEGWDVFRFTKDIDWSKIEIFKDYIDTDVCYDFLNKSVQTYLDDELSVMEWWKSREYFTSLITQIKARNLIIERLAVFAEDVEI